MEESLDMLGVIALGTILVVLAIAVTLAALGIHAVLLGRLPRNRLRRGVERPRVWGAGAISLALTVYTHSLTTLAVGVGLMAIGYVADRKH